jgi:hypothetical protein
LKKLLLSAAVIAATFSANAQNPTTLSEEMRGSTETEDASPCFLGYEDGPGAFQYSPGHDFTNMQWNEANGEITFDATTTSPHGPLYYKFSAGNDAECFPGTGLVDISTASKLEIRAKASTNMKIEVYVQEGNTESWNYSKFSVTALTLNLTTEYQSFFIDNISSDNIDETSTIDLSNIGIVAFELGKEDEIFIPVTDATVSIDYIRLGDAAVSSNEVISSSDVSVFPNPASDVLNVTVNLDEVANVELVDLTGKVVATQTVSNQGTATFNTANLSSGLYIVSIQTANGVVTQKVLVK